MGARARGAVALLMVAGVLGGGAAAYAATGGSKTKPPKSHSTYKMNAARSGNCPNM